MLLTFRQYVVHALVLFGLFVGAATVHPLVHTHAPGETGCSHSSAHSHDHSAPAEPQHSEELPCDLQEAMSNLAVYLPISLCSVQIVALGQAHVSSLPATCRGSWGTFGGRGPPVSISQIV